MKARSYNPFAVAAAESAFELAVAQAASAVHEGAALGIVAFAARDGQPANESGGSAFGRIVRVGGRIRVCGSGVGFFGISLGQKLFENLVFLAEPIVFPDFGVLGSRLNQPRNRKDQDPLK